jgi:hypothetical protein
MNRLVLAQSVHGSQFNGKQEGQATTAHLTCAAPATVKRTSPWALLLSHTPLSALNKRMGRRQRLSPPARIPANKVAVRLKNAPLIRSSTVGDGGEGK